jgi:hypothetical protein
MLETIALEVVGGLIVAITTGVAGYFMALFFERKRYIAKQETAISSFSAILEKAIVQGSPSAVAQARVIVGIRDSSRAELQNLGRLLNSEIDHLSNLLARVEGYNREARQIPQEVVEQISETIQVLRGLWPAKKTQIDVAIRRLLAELGLTPIR